MREEGKEGKEEGDKKLREKRGNEKFWTIGEWETERGGNTNNDE